MRHYLRSVAIGGVLQKTIKILFQYKEDFKMALVEFTIRVQTGEYVDDPLSEEQKAVVERMLNDMEELVGRSEFELDDSEWEELQ
jgi:hypothetical protein